MRLSKGNLITIEGIDGSGKSTFAKNLYEYFQKKNLPAILTKEPSETIIGQQIRNFLKNKIKVSKKAQYLLFAADRAQHFEEIVLPALEAKKIVISDRCADSSLAYQSYGNGLDINIIKEINSWTMYNIQPDLVIYLKIEPGIALERITKRNEEISEFENLNFLRKISKAFDEIFKDRKNILEIDVTKKSQNEVLNCFLQSQYNIINFNL